MKKVVDSSILRSEALRSYLAEGGDRFVIVTDHLAMELFKGDGQTNLSHSLRILSEFPSQVLVLKSTQKILRLKIRASGLHARMIDEEQTTGFRQYCRALFGGLSSYELAADRTAKQSLANRRYERLRGGVPAIRSAIDKLRRGYQTDELKALRKKEPLPDDFWRRFADDVFNTTIAFYRQVPEVPKLTQDGIFFSLVFRYSLCGYACAIDWIAQGGHDSVPDSKLMNDYTDMAYAAYATFYDGILTHDKKLAEIYSFAARMMRVFLRAHSETSE